MDGDPAAQHPTKVTFFMQHAMLTLEMRGQTILQVCPRFLLPHSPTWPSNEGRNAQRWPKDSSPTGHRLSHEPQGHSVLRFPSMLPALVCATAEFLSEPPRRENRSASSNNRWPLNPAL